MDIHQEIKRLEEEIRKTPYNKATEHHIGRLKAKLARLKEEAEKQRKKTGGEQYAIKKEGDATAVLVGYPSVGKSTILNALTGAKSEVGDYDFTTLKPVPGMLEYNGAKIQIVDVPGLIEGASRGRGRGREILAAVRNADIIIIVVDVFTLENIDVLKNELYEGGIRLDEKPPDVVIKKKATGGLSIKSTVDLSIDEQTIRSILREYKIHNGEILIREDITIDRLIDAILGNRAYIPSITVVNKIDLYPDAQIPENAIAVSAEKKINLDKLVEEIYRKLDFIRVYLKPPGGKMEEEPMILRRGARVEDVCRKIHRDLLENFKYARVWGRSVKFEGQKVGLEHELEDGDVITVYAR
ncbi:OBG GTPase family GTP-binding protein [Geoglobus acetivorans]|uniref:GTP-binding protein n=1 Tax=Geoglobus acetivorans TaxID=565033 RepID=A0A0A7GD17_GEOAI|nr:GTP-binding protein [Geoglobus acetivorans]